MLKLRSYILWGIGFPKLNAEDKARQAVLLQGLPPGTRLVAGLSLLLPTVAAIAIALVALSPSLEAFEAWLGLPPAERVAGVHRMIAIAALVSAIGVLILAIWCLMTSAWVKCASARSSLPLPVIEAVARGRYFG